MRTKVIFTALLITSVMALMIPAHAGKGGSGGGGKGGSTSAATGTITVDQNNLHYGDSATFTTSASGTGNATLRIALMCSQNGSVVYMLSGSAGSSFPLGGAGTSSGWSGGEAYCDASLFYYTYQGQTQTGVVTLGDTGFEVAA